MMEGGPTSLQIFSEVERVQIQHAIQKGQGVLKQPDNVAIREAFGRAFLSLSGPAQEETSRVLRALQKN